MTHPTSLRLPDPVKDRLDRRASQGHERASAIAVRLIDEGLRMDDHPGVAFHDSPAHGRVACLANGPDIAEVIDILTGLDAQGDDRVAEAATWFGIHTSRVQVALDYYTDFRDEIDGQVDLRRREAEAWRGRHQAQQALLE